MPDTETAPTSTQQPDALRLADALKRRAPIFDGLPTLDQTEKEMRRLHAENEALRAKMELVDYVLQDNLHNRLTPRVVDIAYSAFASGRGGRSEDGEPCDWFNDTKPRVVSWIDKIKKDLAEEAAHGIGEQP